MIRLMHPTVSWPQDWHQDAVRAAYSSDDEEWRLTAVFCMRFVRGFEKEIVESLATKNPDIRYEAVVAAIDAISSIRPAEASEMLIDLIESQDEDIVEAAHEAMAMAEALEHGEWDEDDDDEFLH